MNVRTAGVVGAGTMGSGIAQKLAQEGSRVILVDLDDAKVAAGMARVRASLDEAVARKIFDRARADAALARIEGTSRFEALADADLVIEAVFEDLGVKGEVFARLDAVCRADAVLATNTSSFRVADVAKATKRPERVVGLHFFYHPAKNRLVEVVPHPTTAPAALATAWSHQERTGKTPIGSKDAPGFVVNRYFVPWLNEAVRLLDEKVATIPAIEAVAKEVYGTGMGPFELMNVTGLPIALHSANTLGRELGTFYEASPLLAAQVQSGRPWDLTGPSEGNREEVRRRLLGGTFLIAGEILDEGIARAEDVDLGARVGLRWPKGPLELANATPDARALAEAVARRHGRKLPRAFEAMPFVLEKVRLSIEGDLATITLDRPDALNALDESVVAELEERFRAADADPAVKGILIRGRGKAFVAGADVKWFVRQLDAKAVDRIVAFTRKGQELFKALGRSRKVVVAAVEGLSLGGGSELALACDYAVATPRGSLGFPETGIGIYPGLGGTQRLPRRVGRGLARWLIYTGRTLSADEAVALGAFDEVVPPEEVLAAARRWIAKGKPGERRPREQTHPAARVFDVDARAVLEGRASSEDPALAKDLERVRAQKAPVALRIADELVAGALEKALDRGLEDELARLPEIFGTKDAYEGLSSLGRARPRFVGA